MNRKILYGLISILFFAGIGTAIWLSGMKIQGLIIGNTGTQPTEQSFIENINITNGNTISFVKNYTNSDGIHNLTFSLDDSLVVSTNPLCTYQSGIDFVMKINSIDIKTNPIVTLAVGQNPINVTVIPSANRYLINGTYIIQGVLS